GLGRARVPGGVARAASANPGIAQAAARPAQARAVLRAPDAERAPQASLGAGITRQGGGVANASGTAGTLASAGANLSYELDLFGRLAKASDAAALDAKAQQALLQSTRLLVQANVAPTYFPLRALDNERTPMRAPAA